MTNTGYICHRLIDDIIKRGGNELSDRYVVKKCLKKFVVSNKKMITNELIQQTGIKTQNCTIEHQFQAQSHPKQIKNNQCMYISILNKPKSKVRSKSISVNRGKSVSFSKIANKKQMIKTSETDKKIDMTNNTQKRPQKTKNQNYLIELQQYKRKPPTQSQTRQISLVDSMRQYVIQKQRKNKQQMLRAQQQLRNRETAKMKTKKDFQKQLNGGDNEHTYNLNGNYVVYPISNKKKSLSNNYPISLVPAIHLINEKKKKKNIKNPQKSVKQVQQTFHQTLHSNSENSHHKLKSTIDLKSQLYNNNNQRQISSLIFFNAKPGVSFTEPSQGRTVRCQNQFKQSSVFQRNRKSKFSKFFTEETSRTKTNGFFNLKNQSVVSKFSMLSKPCKTQYYEQNTDSKNSLLVTRRPKTTGSGAKGKMIDINESFLFNLINNL